MSILNRNGKVSKDAEDFDALTDGRSPVRVYDAELERLARVTDALRATEAVVPRPEFAANLRERLMAEAAVELQNAPVPLQPLRREGRAARRIAIGVSATVLVGGLAGVSAASQQATPGDVLFPIKRSIEKVTGSTEASTAALDAADDKLAALEELVTSGAKVDKVSAGVDEFTAAAGTAADQLAAGGTDAKAKLQRFIDRSTTVLQQLSITASPKVTPELAKATLAVKLLQAKLG